MQSHDDLVKRLESAAQRGEDLLAILRAERDHVVQCATCREKVAQLIVNVHGEEGALFLALMRLEELNLLEEPSEYPRLDLSFLSNVWVPGPPGSGEGTGQPVRQLADDVELRIKVYKRRMDAAFEGLSDWLSSTVIPAREPVLAPARRGKRVARGQVLSLPDPAENLDITLAVQAAGRGRGHLSIEVRTMEPDRPVGRATVSLNYPEGSEVTRTRAGKAAFIELEPDEYTIEVEPAVGEKPDQVWQFTITLEST